MWREGGKSRQEANTDDDEWQPTSEESQHEKEVVSDSGKDSEEDAQPVASLPVAARVDVGASKAKKKKPKEYEWISPKGLDEEGLEMYNACVEEEKRRLLSPTNYSTGSSADKMGGNSDHEPDKQKKAAASPLTSLRKTTVVLSQTNERKL